MSKLAVLILAICLFVGEARYVRRHRNGVVVSAAPGCAEIGINIMKKGGTVIDVVIATAFCESIVNPTTMGLGGGFIATIYNKTTDEVWAFNARETAPAAATSDMFIKNPNTGGYGPLNIAVPGELRGYWYLYRKHGGKVPWKSLIQPTILMCTKGILMNEFTEKMLQNVKENVMVDPVLKKVYVDPLTNDIYKAGERYTNILMAKTLTIIANEGGEAMHEGSLTKLLVQDIQKQGGIISKADFNDYKPEILTPVYTKIAGNKHFYSFPLPASGPIVAYILNILDNYLDTESPVTVDNVQKLTESLKFGYAQRSLLGDSDFVKGLDEIVENLTSKKFAEETRQKIYPDTTFQDPVHYGAYFGSKNDHGTANICVWGPNGDGIALTSSINYILGARSASKSTGIIWNNSMDDFSTPNQTNIFGFPPSPSNYIQPGKRPMSSMCPSIILDQKGDLYMIIGGAGGSKIISGVAQVIINHIFYNMDIFESSNAKRLHHQLLPMQISFENEWLFEDRDIPKALKKIGHNVTFANADGFAAVTCVSVDENKENSVIGVTDKRRYGEVAYLPDTIEKNYA